MAEEDIRAHFLGQAEGCDALGSPFTAALCRVLARILDVRTATGKAVLGWRADARADAVALRLCGALHALVLSDADQWLASIYPPNETSERQIAAVLPAAIERSDERILASLAGAPQTNEIARSAMLLPGFLTIAQETGLRLDLCEIGASAGLNLLFDRFHYRYGGDEWGSSASPVKLAPVMRGNSIPVRAGLSIGGRAGCDIAPINISDPKARLRLRSYIWPDQPARLARLDAAMALAGQRPPFVIKADAADFVENALANRPGDGTFVLYHSIMWQYLPAATKAAITASLDRAGGAATHTAPVAWLRMEPLSTGNHFATLSLTQWPDGRTRTLARCDYHGSWIEWTG